MEKRGDQAVSIVGISPGNSHFSQENIQEALEELAGKNEHIIVMIADALDAHNQKAMGRKNPEGKARSEGNALRNKVGRAIEDLKLNAHVLDWKREVEGNEIYQTRLKVVETLYAECHAFREKVNEAGQSVLKGRRPEINFDAQAIREAANYLLKEFAYLDAASEIHGVKKATFIYHKDWELLRDYIRGEFDHIPRRRMGFRVTGSKNEDS